MLQFNRSMQKKRTARRIQPECISADRGVAGELASGRVGRGRLRPWPAVILVQPVRLVMKNPTKRGFRTKISKAGRGEKRQMMTQCHGEHIICVLNLLSPLHNGSLQLLARAPVTKAATKTASAPNLFVFFLLFSCQRSNRWCHYLLM